MVEEKTSTKQNACGYSIVPDTHRLAASHYARAHEACHEVRFRKSNIDHHG